MNSYKAVQCGKIDAINLQVVQNLQTYDFYLTVKTYAALAEISVTAAENKAQTANAAAGVLYNAAGWTGAEGLYLIPVKIVFSWLLVDNPQKTSAIGTDAITESIKNLFDNGFQLETVEKNLQDTLNQNQSKVFKKLKK